MSERIGQLVVEPGMIGVPGGDGPATINGPEELFEHVRSDPSGRYRPLSGAKTLRDGWQAPLSQALSAQQAIEIVYPLALVHRQQLRDGSLRVVGLDEVLARQSGRYEDSSALSQAGRRRAIDVVCGECVRRPVWAGAACSAADIPCPEPCSVLVAFCREAAGWEREAPPASPVDPDVPWAAFDQPGNGLRERYLREGASS